MLKPPEHYLTMTRKRLRGDIGLGRDTELKAEVGMGMVSMAAPARTDGVFEVLCVGGGGDKADLVV